MSFVIAVTPFLRVELSTDDAANVPFGLTPTRTTQELMANHGIVYRPTANGLALYAKSNPAVNPALLRPISSRSRFSFAMSLTDAGFFQRYHPDFADSTAQILLDNLDGVGAIQPAGVLSAGPTIEVADLTAVGPTIYAVRLGVSGGAPPVIEAQNRFTGAVVGTTDLVLEAGQTELETFVDLTTAPDAAVQLVAAAPVNLDRSVYADSEISDSGAAGVLDLYWDQPQDAVPAGSGAVYTAQFRRRL